MPYSAKLAVHGGGTGVTDVHHLAGSKTGGSNWALPRDNDGTNRDPLKTWGHQANTEGAASKQSQKDKRPQKTGTN